LTVSVPLPVSFEERTGLPAGPLLDIPDHIFSVLEALPAAVYTTDAEGLITFYNQAAVDLAGRKPTLGDQWCVTWKLYRPDGTPLPHDECPMAVALKEGRPVRGEEAVAERPDGTRVPFMPYPTPLYDNSGALIGAVNMLLDLSDSKRADAALRESEATFRAIVDQATAGIAETDATGRFVLANERYCEMVGYSRAELLGMRMQDITHPDDLPRNLELFDSLARGGADFVIEKRYLRKDKAVVWVRNSVSCIRDATGGVANLVAVSVDIADRKRGEDAARRLASIVESSDDAIVSKDLNGVITSWNGGAQRLFGYSAEEVIGKPVTILFPPDRYDEEPGILERIRRGERIDHYETVRRRKDGSLVDISLTVSPLRDAEGRIIGASKIARDITLRKRVEEQQQLLLGEMRHRIKNLFAVASSVVSLSARSADTPQAMADAVRDRLAALTRAQELTRPGLTDGVERAGQDTTLHALIRAIFAPYCDPVRTDDPECLVLDGSDVPVRGSAVTSLALVLHELATNAAKYGALSVPEGIVRIDCSAGEGSLVLAWREQRGPALAGEPDGQGFGSMLAHRTVVGQFGGSIARDWRAEGLAIRVTVPLAALAG
jgi:PAS domain S-box-containing protein